VFVVVIDIVVVVVIVVVFKEEYNSQTQKMQFEICHENHFFAVKTDSFETDKVQ